MTTRSTKKHAPIHPGEILRDEFLLPLGLTQYRLAKETGIPEDRVSKLVNGARAVTADTALRLARYFGTSAAFWMNLQARFDLDVASDERGRDIEKRVKPYRAA